MKKKIQVKKQFNLNKEVVSNLNDIKGGDIVLSLISCPATTKAGKSCCQTACADTCPGWSEDAVSCQC